MASGWRMCCAHRQSQHSTCAWLQALKLQHTLTQWHITLHVFRTCLRWNGCRTACRTGRRSTAAWCQARLQGTTFKKGAPPCHHTGSRPQTGHCLQGRPTPHPPPWPGRHRGSLTCTRTGRCRAPTWTLPRPWRPRHRRQLLPLPKVARPCSRNQQLQAGHHNPQTHFRRATSP